MNEIQQKVKKFCDDNNLNTSFAYTILDLMSEVGEVSKEILKITSYGQKPLVYKEELSEELGDVFFSLIAAANAMNIDLQESLDKVLAKYTERLEKGSAGSEVSQ